MDWVNAQRHLARLQSWEKGYGQWALEEKATGAMIGHAGFSYPHDWPGFELGWVLARDRWGNGFATEAGTAAPWSPSRAVMSCPVGLVPVR